MNRRNHQRKHLLLSCLVYVDDEPVGYIGNLSAGGLLFVGERAWAVGQEMAVRIHAEDAPDWWQVDVDARVEIRWCKPHVDAGLYCIGCSFTHLGDLGKAQLLQLARRVGIDLEYSPIRQADPIEALDLAAFLVDD